jgi:hypothetical protein
MFLQPSYPKTSINLAKLRTEGISKIFLESLESIFRQLFKSMDDNQVIVAKVVNNNALVTLTTANLPLGNPSLDNTSIIEDTGTSRNLIIYAKGGRYRITGVSF